MEVLQNFKLQNYRWQHTFIVVMCAYVWCAFLAEPVFAVTVQSLQQPIRDLKAEVFGGWMGVVKIGAAAMGIIFSTVKGSLTPLGIGMGIAAGTHFFSSWLGDGANGALI